MALGKIDTIKTIYTSVTQESIFNICPFKIKKTAKGFETKINHFNTLRTFLKKSATFGESENLRSLIKKNVTEEDFKALNESDKKVIVAVSNLTEDKAEYINSKQHNREDFCDWLWASCNFIPFMSLFTKDGKQYADGGFGSFIPILCAIENGATDIDVIILDNEFTTKWNKSVTNPFSLLLRTFRFMNTQNISKDLIIGKLVGLNKKVNINFYYTPRQLTDNPLIFDTQQMTQWWQEGYEFAKEKNPVSFCNIPSTVSKN